MSEIMKLTDVTVDYNVDSQYWDVYFMENEEDSDFLYSPMIGSFYFKSDAIKFAKDELFSSDLKVLSILDIEKDIWEFFDKEEEKEIDELIISAIEREKRAFIGTTQPQ